MGISPSKNVEQTYFQNISHTVWKKYKHINGIFLIILKFTTSQKREIPIKKKYKIKKNLHKALSMPEFSIRIDNFFMWLEAFGTSGAEHALQSHFQIPNSSTIFNLFDCTLMFCRKYENNYVIFINTRKILSKIMSKHRSSHGKSMLYEINLRQRWKYALLSSMSATFPRSTRFCPVIRWLMPIFGKSERSCWTHFLKNFYHELIFSSLFDINFDVLAQNINLIKII